MSDPIQQIRAALESGRLTVNRMDDGTAVVLDIEGEQLMTLNATALCLVGWISDGESSVRDLSGRLVEKYQVEQPRAQEDVTGFVDKLCSALR